MRYNIKRLFNEIVMYERQMELLKNAPHASSIDEREFNRLNHATSLCKKYIGEEVIARWKEGKNLNVEVEEVKLDL